MKAKNLENFGRDFATLNLIPGKKVYGERLVKKGEIEYRKWDPYRSKLGTALIKRLRTFPFNENSSVLYLGAGNGTTASHISDICPNGQIFCVEFSPRAMMDLYLLCQQRKNLIPILADANKPQDYADRIEPADILYMDVAQKSQVQILIKNADMFLKPGGIAYLMVKARSIDVVMEPTRVFQIVRAKLSTEFKVLETILLNPFEKDHMCIVLEKAGQQTI